MSDLQSCTEQRLQIIELNTVRRRLNMSLHQHKLQTTLRLKKNRIPKTGWYNFIKIGPL